MQCMDSYEAKLEVSLPFRVTPAELDIRIKIAPIHQGEVLTYMQLFRNHLSGLENTVVS